jgi:hypothetical protein
VSGTDSAPPPPAAPAAARLGAIRRRALF